MNELNNEQYNENNLLNKEDFKEMNFAELSIYIQELNKIEKELEDNSGDDNE